MASNRAHAAILLTCCSWAAAWAQDLVELDTTGGDAWAFERPVSGRYSVERCRDIAIESPRGTINATLIGDHFYANTLLRAGENTITVVCRNERGVRAQAKSQAWHVPLRDAPKAAIRARIDQQAIRLNAGATTPAIASSVPIVSYSWRAREGNPGPLQLVDGATLETAAGEEIHIATPNHDGEYYVELRATDALGRSDAGATAFRVMNGQPQLIDVRTEHPAWLDRAVLYGAAPYEFAPQSFAGVQARLDEIAALGATAVWLSPITAAAPDDFGYAVTDQFAFRRQFGTDQEFRSLIATAHGLGLRVVLDFVPNHFSQFHRYFADAEAAQSRSPYYAWFDRDAHGTVTQYFDWSHLKNLNFDHPEVRNHIIAAAARYVRDYDIDGFRIDASWAVAQRAPEFWPQLRAELKRIDPDIALIAEASAREPYHVSHGFDAAYDWTENLGEWAWRDVFADAGSVDLARLRAALTNDGRGYPPDSLILRFLNNNDTGERFITRFGADTARLAATLLFTLPGLPLIYNGDEIGAAFQPYDEGPPLLWEPNALTDHYRHLATLRRQIPALQSREMQLLKTDCDDNVLAFVRPGATPAESVLVLLNFSDKDLLVRSADTKTREIFGRYRDSRELLTHERSNGPRSRARLKIRSKQALILQPTPPATLHSGNSE
jgi:glycosidase